MNRLRGRSYAKNCVSRSHLAIIWALRSLDLGCHCHESLLYVCRVLGTGFQKGNLELIGKFLQVGQSHKYALSCNSRFSCWCRNGQKLWYDDHLLLLLWNRRLSCLPSRTCCLPIACWRLCSHIGQFLAAMSSHWRMTPTRIEIRIIYWHGTCTLKTWPHPQQKPHFHLSISFPERPHTPELSVLISTHTGQSGPINQLSNPRHCMIPQYSQPISLYTSTGYVYTEILFPRILH